MTAMGSGKALTLEGQDLALLLGSPLLLIGYKSFTLDGDHNRYFRSIDCKKKPPLVLWSGCARIGTVVRRSDHAI